MSIPPIAVQQPDAWSAGYRQGRADAVALLDQHIPSITDAMDEGIGEWAGLWPRDDEGNYNGDQRVCHCGQKIDGFYEYVDHLKEVLS